MHSVHECTFVSRQMYHCISWHLETYRDVLLTHINGNFICQLLFFLANTAKLFNKIANDCTRHDTKGKIKN